MTTYSTTFDTNTVTAAQIDAAYKSGGYVRYDSITGCFDIYYGGKWLGAVEKYRFGIEQLVFWHEMVLAEQKGDNGNC